LVFPLPTFRILEGSVTVFGSSDSIPKKLARLPVSVLVRLVVVAFFKLAVSFMLTRMVTMSPTCAAR
jgi:type IV secretory pathway TrbL component